MRKRLSYIVLMQIIGFHLARTKSTRWRGGWESVEDNEVPAEIPPLFPNMYVLGCLIGYKMLPEWSA